MIEIKINRRNNNQQKVLWLFLCPSVGVSESDLSQLESEIVVARQMKIWSPTDLLSSNWRAN